MNTTADALPHQPLPADKALYGGFWRRFLALIIDTIIIACAFYVLETLVGLLIADFSLTGTGVVSLQFLSLVWTWLYFAVTHSSAAQASPGKRLLGLKVTDLNGHRISFGRATGRYFAETFSALLLFFGYLLVLFTRRRQCLHDMIADTLVPRREVNPVAGTTPADAPRLKGWQLAVMAFGLILSVGIGLAMAIYLPAHL